MWSNLSTFFQPVFCLAARAERPRHLMVIINPMGGKKKAVRIYARSVEPLLQRAAIKTTVHHVRILGIQVDT